MGIKPKREVLLPEPEFPEPIRYLWNWFAEIRLGVQGNGMTYPVITWEALHCWTVLTRVEIAPREARTIVTLGNIWAAVMVEKAEKKSDAAKH